MPGRPLVLVIGSLNMDLTVRVERFPRPGETVRGSDLVRAPGGKGANQAVAAARAGARVAMAGAVGGDSFGAELLQVLDREGIDRRHVRVVRGTPTGIAAITVDRSGENHIVISPGANARVTPASLHAIRPLLARAGLLLLQREIPAAAIEAALAAASAAGTRAILNPAPAGVLPRALQRRVHALIVNEAEAETILGSPVRTSAAAREAAESLAARTGGGLAIVTRGSRGAWLKDRAAGPPVRIAPHRVRALDTTAAGDAFAGAFAARYAAGAGALAAARFAAAAGALAATRPGAIPSLPRRAEIEALLGRRRG
jgi:ribokinase